MASIAEPDRAAAPAGTTVVLEASDIEKPYAGSDWDTYLKFWQLVAQRRKTGRTVLIISHFVADADRFDRIVDLREGKTVPR